MPTYEYACTACGQRLEAVQNFTDDPLTECPECGGVLRKVYGAVGIVLKGSGFYKTDSRAAAAANGKGKKSATSGGDTGRVRRSAPQGVDGRRTAELRASGSAPPGSGSTAAPTRAARHGRRTRASIARRAEGQLISPR